MAAWASTARTTGNLLGPSRRARRSLGTRAPPPARTSRSRSRPRRAPRAGALAGAGRRPGHRPRRRRRFRPRPAGPAETTRPPALERRRPPAPKGPRCAPHPYRPRRQRQRRRANPLPPYRGFRHQVQERNAELATAVEIFFRTGDFDALPPSGPEEPGEQVMLLAYLIANDFAGAGARARAGVGPAPGRRARRRLDRGQRRRAGRGFARLVEGGALMSRHLRSTPSCGARSPATTASSAR
jgi:hypothetical protein